MCSKQFSCLPVLDGVFCSFVLFSLYNSPGDALVLDGGFVLCRLNQTGVCDRAILLFLRNFVIYFFFSFSTNRRFKSFQLIADSNLRLNQISNLRLHQRRKCGKTAPFSVYEMTPTLNLHSKHQTLSNPFCTWKNHTFFADDPIFQGYCSFVF